MFEEQQNWNACTLSTSQKYLRLDYQKYCHFSVIYCIILPSPHLVEMNIPLVWRCLLLSMCQSWTGATSDASHCIIYPGLLPNKNIFNFYSVFVAWLTSVSNWREIMTNKALLRNMWRSVRRDTLCYVILLLFFLSNSMLLPTMKCPELYGWRLDAQV